MNDYLTPYSDLFYNLLIANLEALKICNKNPIPDKGYIGSSIN